MIKYIRRMGGYATRPLGRYGFSAYNQIHEVDNALECQSSSCHRWIRAGHANPRSFTGMGHIDDRHRWDMVTMLLVGTRTTTVADIRTRDAVRLGTGRRPARGTFYPP